MFKKLIGNYPLVILVLISLILCFLNYTSQTYLSGWDTLHPEFNLNLNLQRVLNGVFRLEQGLGAVAAHAHIADLPHILILYVLNFIFPLSFVRYSYIFLNLIIGPLGMYLFLNKFITKNKLSSFLGSLFYLLNLGTMQQFIVPFEMFIVQYAFLPYLFYFATDFFYSKNNNKILLGFAVTAFLASPMAYAATLWYVYFLCFLIYLTFLCIPEVIKRNFLSIKRAIILTLTTLLINAYWLLPNLYHALTQAALVSKANINALFSDQAFLYNKEFGNFQDISLLKTYLFDWGVYFGNNKFDNLLFSWIEHLNSPYVLQIGFVFAALGIIGIIYSIYLKNRIGISFLPVLIFSLFFLINDNSPTGFLYVFFQNHLPLFKEALRFPENKILGIYIFLYAMYFAFAMQFIYFSFNKIKPKVFSKGLVIIQIIAISCLLFYYMLPAFKGNLISPFMRISIPKEYFETFNWFNNREENGRIAYLPVNSLWGWEYYNWYENKPSFQGAGFIWFGIKQPILVRDFDRWNLKNEQFYKEISYAVYSQNDSLVKEIIEKYQIQYLLFDKNIIAPDNDHKSLYYEEIESILRKLENENIIKNEANFNKIYIYKTTKNYDYENILTNAKNILPETQSYYADFAYLDNKAYFSSNNYPSINYQFRNIIDNQGKTLKTKINLENDGVKIALNSENFSTDSFLDLEDKINASVLIKKQSNKAEVNIYPQLPYQKNDVFLPLTALINTNDSGMILSINKNYNFAVNNLIDNSPLIIGNVFLNTKKENTISAYALKPDKTIIPDFSQLNLSINPCYPEKTTDIFGIELEDEKNSFSIFAKKSPICITIPLNSLLNQISEEKILLSLDYDYQGKVKSSFCIMDISNGSCLNYLFKNVSEGITKPTLNYFEIDKKDFKNLAIKIQIDEYSGFLTEKNTFSNFIVGISSPFYSASFSKNLLEQSLGKLNNINSNIISIPFSGYNELSKDITTLPISDVNCKKDPFSINNNQEKEIFKEQTQKYIRYSSKDGSACDHFSYSTLTHNQGYLIAVSSRNIQGLPLTICVLNQKSRHCDIYANLTNSKEFKKDIFLLPPMSSINSNDSGYDISISNLGIEGTSSINDIESIQIIPIPYYFLSSLKTDSNTENKQIYTLSYAFENGFNAYLVNKNSVLEKTLPFVFGKKLKNHVLVNNWSNGWILDDLDVNKSKIIIVYYPQYFEYFGLFILLITFIILGLKTLKKHQ